MELELGVGIGGGSFTAETGTSKGMGGGGAGGAGGTAPLETRRRTRLTKRNEERIPRGDRGEDARREAGRIDGERDPDMLMIVLESIATE